MEHQHSPPPPPPPQPLKTYSLTASSISYTKTTTNSTTITHLLFKTCVSTPPTYILKNVSFTAYPSQILAVVGPSGAGKSTLLDILASRTSPTTGTILLNSSPINPSSYRKISAYVPQYDACLPLLTVNETFHFAAGLLLSDARGGSKITESVNSLLDELRLSHVANTRLADGLSGGERRRVSIGLSLLHNPAVLLLDEPTSGLDSTSAFNVIQTLKSVSVSHHRTIILSIHQPSFKILNVIDKVLLLSKGMVVHHGTLFSLEAFLVSNGFSVPPQLNSLESAMEILNNLQLTKTITQNQSIDPNVSPKSDFKAEIRYKSSRKDEILALYSRFWKIIYRTKQLLLTNTLEALIVGLVLGTIYINIGIGIEGIHKRSGLFAFTLTFLLSSTTETLPIYINERPILVRETSSGIYRVSSYLIANTLVFIPYLLAISIIYSVSVYFLVGLCSSWQAFAYFVLIIWVIVLMANSLVLLLSSIAPNYISGTSLVTILLAGFFLFSGYFISQDRLPKYWLFMHFLSMYKYGLDALQINEYTCMESESKCLVLGEGDGGTEMCSMTGGDVLEKQGLHAGMKWVNVGILFVFFVVYRLLCLFVLIKRVSRSKK